MKLKDILLFYSFSYLATIIGHCLSLVDLNDYLDCFWRHACFFFEESHFLFLFLFKVLIKSSKLFKDLNSFLFNSSGNPENPDQSGKTLLEFKLRTSWL